MLKKNSVIKNLGRATAASLLLVGLVGCGNDFDSDRRHLPSQGANETSDAPTAAKKPIVTPDGHIVQIVNGKVVNPKPQPAPTTSQGNQNPQPTETKNAPALDPNARCIGASAEICGIEEAMAKYTNDYRRSKGLAPLTFDPRVAYAARVWSQKSAARGQVVHATPQDHMSVLRPAFPGVRFNLAAENMALTPSYHGSDLNAEANGIVQLWIKDKPHRDNLLGNFHGFGIGAHFAGGYWWVTQVFMW